MAAYEDRRGSFTSPDVWDKMYESTEIYLSFLEENTAF